MGNARQELLDHVGFMSKIKGVKIVLGSEYGPCPQRVFVLKVGHTVGDAEKFLKSIDFEYDDGFGSQELFGNIWYHDGTYSQRGEYDGSEWWDHCKCPELPEDVK